MNEFTVKLPSSPRSNGVHIPAREPMPVYGAMVPSLFTLPVMGRLAEEDMIKVLPRCAMRQGPQALNSPMMPSRLHC